MAKIERLGAILVCAALLAPCGGAARAQSFSGAGGPGGPPPGAPSNPSSNPLPNPALPDPGPPAAPVPPSRPGLLHELGRFLDPGSLFAPRAGAPAEPAPVAPAPPSAAAVEPAAPPEAPTLPSASDRAGRAVEAARGALSAAGAAAGAVGAPATQMVTGRVACGTAPNGAPDCQTAAVQLCRDKGFAGGRSLAIESAQKCPIWAQWPGRRTNPGECAVQSFVTQAFCQLKL